MKTVAQILGRTDLGKAGEIELGESEIAQLKVVAEDRGMTFEQILLGACSVLEHVRGRKLPGVEVVLGRKHMH